MGALHGDTRLTTNSRYGKAMSAVDLVSHWIIVESWCICIDSDIDANTIGGVGTTPGWVSKLCWNSLHLWHWHMNTPRVRLVSRFHVVMSSWLLWQMISERSDVGWRIVRVTPTKCRTHVPLSHGGTDSRRGKPSDEDLTYYSTYGVGCLFGTRVRVVTVGIWLILPVVICLS